jgi:hypothetical protein
LVPDDAWFEALDRLVSHARERKRLARSAEAWARRQTIDAVADRWEQVFAAAAGPKATTRAPVARGSHSGFALKSGMAVRIRPRTAGGNRNRGPA